VIDLAEPEEGAGRKRWWPGGALKSGAIGEWNSMQLPLHLSNSFPSPREHQLVAKVFHYLLFAETMTRIVIRMNNAIATIM
jgi:hypothetical protein